MTETLAEESAESVIRRLTEEVKTSNEAYQQAWEEREQFAGLYGEAKESIEKLNAWIYKAAEVLDVLRLPTMATEGRALASKAECL